MIIDWASTIGPARGAEPVYFGVANHEAQAGVAGQRVGQGIGDGEHGDVPDMGVGYGFHDGVRIRRN